VTQGAIPEPASWAMLITGFGLVGAARRRQRLATV
jgi:PEP-CTERM motif